MSFFWQRISGSNSGEDIFGTDLDDVVFGFGGDDFISTGLGNDIIFAGRGNDTIDPGDGNDLVFAGSGDDEVAGSRGNDLVLGGRGFDTVTYVGSINDYAITPIGRAGARVTSLFEDLPDAGDDFLIGVEALYFVADDYTLFLNGQNNAVLAGDDAATTGENETLNILAADLLANDQEFDGDTISIIDVQPISDQGATVTFDGGVVSYEPGSLFDGLAEGEEATDKFTYTVDDGKGGTDTATVTVTITGVNDGPVLLASDAVVEENTTAVDAAVSATDVDSATLTFALSGTDAGFFDIDENTGVITFLAAPDFEDPLDDDADNIYDLTVSVTDSEGGEASQDITVTVTDVDEVPPFEGRLNEIHYDNEGGDTGEFIEVRVALGSDVSLASVELYNGSNGTLYGSADLSAGEQTSDGAYDYYVLNITDLGVPGIQNGSPDGFALINDGAVLEFLSYEGSFTATSGTASGMTSEDIGVSEPGSTPIGQSLQRNEDGTWRGPEEETRGAANDAVVGEFAGRLNEIHYDNDGGDTGEFIEVRVALGSDVSLASVELYNGSNGTLYGSADLSAGELTSDGAYDYYVLNITDLGVPGIQNGSPDGFALINDGAVLEFLSYEGSFTATSGTALGMTSEDIGVSEPGSTPIGQSLQRNEDGTWRGPEEETRGAANDAVVGAVALNELVVSTTGTDWEFFELFGAAGTSLDGMALVQISGNASFSGQVNTVISLDGFSIGEDGFFLGASPEAILDLGIDPLAVDLDIANDTFENFSSSFLLVEGVTGLSEGDDLDTDNDGVLDVTPWSGIVDGVAISDDDAPFVFAPAEVGPDGTFLAPGAKRETDGTGDFAITSFASEADYTPGSTNTPPPPTEITLISAIQGAGGESPFVGQQLTVSAIVTHVIAGRGFFLQEEDTDADGDALTSEGIFVFTGGGAGVALGDLVEVTGTVSEFFGETQLGSITATEIISSRNVLPTAAQIALDPAVAQDFEAIEGMLVTVTTGTVDPLTVIENFNLDRFGEITISAGRQTQATQLFDAQTEAADVAATIEGNLNNRLLLDDGFTNQNPDEFVYLPGGAGDQGNGFLDAGDDFGDAGTTLRLGSELTADVSGVMGFGFGEYRLYATETLQVDEATNSGAREAAPEDVGGSLQLASFNVLNYFTTLDEGNNGSGPNNLNPRGADTASELQRQQDKLVEGILGTGAEVLALQEIENGGFGPGSAGVTLAEALNSEDPSRDFQIVDPTADAGFIGTDAISTGILYDANVVTLIDSDFIVFDEASAATTFAVSQALADLLPSENPVGDFQRNRPSVAATFEDAEGNQFTVVSSHFKSKGPSGLDDLAESAQGFLDDNPGNTPVAEALAALLADPNFDQGDGQGFWNQVRLDASVELYDWIENDYAGTGVSDYALLGDFNAYAQEDAVQYLRDTQGLTDIIDDFAGGQDEAYSFVFDGQQGTLDQGLASDSLAAFITGATEWHINADEPDLINYDESFKNPAFYNPGVFASSDHDPLIFGIEFDQLLS